MQNERPEAWNPRAVRMFRSLFDDADPLTLVERREVPEKVRRTRHHGGGEILGPEEVAVASEAELDPVVQHRLGLLLVEVHRHDAKVDRCALAQGEQAGQQGRLNDALAVTCLRAPLRQTLKRNSPCGGLLC